MALGKEFLLKCWGERCPEACPFCHAICTVDHSSTTTVAPEHSCATHFLLAFAGWRDKTSKDPEIFSCVESSRNLRKYKARADPETWLDFGPWMDLHYQPPAKKWFIEEKADSKFLTLTLEKNIRRAYANMQPRFAAYWDYNMGVPQAFADLYTGGQSPLTPFSPLPRPGRVLVLCGGGIRGLIQLRMLHQLEEKMGKRIYELFDLIVGTSVGAINAAAIALLKWPIISVINLFQEISKLVFPPSGTLAKTVRILASGMMYDSTPLAELLKLHFGFSTPLADYFNTWPKVCIIAAETSVDGTPKQVNFRTYDVDNDAGAHRGCSRAALWKALLASASAPIYFSECKVPLVEGGQDSILVDGGILANNGSRTAIDEAKLLFHPSTGGEYLHSLLCIGTGTLVAQPHQSGKGPALYDIFGIVHKLGAGLASAKASLTNMAKVVTDSEAVHAEVSALSKTLRFKYSYLNVTLGEAAMDNSSDSLLLYFQEQAMRYLTSPEGKDQVARAVDTMQASTFSVTTNPGTKPVLAASEEMKDSLADLKASLTLKDKTVIPVKISLTANRKEATLDFAARSGVLLVTFNNVPVLNGRVPVSNGRVSIP